MTRFLLLLTSCTFLALAGCGGGGSKVTGKVSYNGKPLNSGTILFQTEEGVRSATIQSDGTYTIEDVPAGNAKIAVTVAPPPEKGPDGVSADEAGTSEANPVLVPEKYSRVETSELTYKVTSGEQTHDIDLK